MLIQQRIIRRQSRRKLNTSLPPSPPTLSGIRKVINYQVFVCIGLGGHFYFRVVHQTISVIVSETRSLVWVF